MGGVGVGLHVDRDVAQVQVVIDKVFFDDVAHIAEADHEFIEAIMAIMFHDVPDDRFATDLHHGLRAKVGFFGETGAEAPGENDDFQNL